MSPTLLASSSVSLPGADADERLSMVIIGLFALAGIITVVSIAYWWVTRPGRVRPGDGT